MFTIRGKFVEIKVFASIVDNEAIKQLYNLANSKMVEGSKVAVMPDVHCGKSACIGFTQKITDKICPNLVGVDIGCGMETLVIHKDSEASRNFNPAILDSIIRKNIPCGFDIRKSAHKYVEEVEWDKIKGQFTQSRAKLSLGTLGGGNHFIEADRDEDGNLYIVVHSGSRHAGLEIANYYQEMAWQQLNNNTKVDIEAMITELKSQGRQSEIEEKRKELKAQIKTSIPKDLAYVSGYLFDDYINDMKIMQHFACLNRKAMIDIISIGLHLKQDEIVEQFTTIHNYIDTDNMILRKGAVSAKKGEKLLIPINMRDGSLVCIGKGNEDWNCSAPHGAGRLMSRSQAKKEIPLDLFEESMKGIYTTSVNSSTIDESPFAYKNIKDIVNNIGPTVDIVRNIKPIYNFKASE